MRAGWSWDDPKYDPPMPLMEAIDTVAAVGALMNTGLIDELPDDVMIPQMLPLIRAVKTLKTFVEQA